MTDRGTGWAVGHGGPPLYRDELTGKWRPRDDVPLGSKLISVGIASSDDVWFGSHPGTPDTPAQLVHYDGSRFAVTDAPTNLPIWCVLADGAGGMWAIASSWQSPTEPAVTDIMILSDGVWRLATRLTGERLVNGAVLGSSSLLAVGTGVFACSPTSCTRQEAIQSAFVVDATMVTSDEGYAIDSHGVLYRFDGSRWSVDDSFKSDAIGFHALAGGSHCIVASSPDGLWIRSGDDWSLADRIGSPSLAFTFLDLVAADNPDATLFWGAGTYDTIVAGACRRQVNPTATGSKAPTESPTPAWTATPSPRRTALLPWLQR
jgi:hypothetical protein